MGGWLKVTCGLTACTPGSAPGPTLGNEYGRTLPLPVHNDDSAALANKTHYGQVEANGTSNEKYLMQTGALADGSHQPMQW